MNLPFEHSLLLREQFECHNQVQPPNSTFTNNILYFFFGLSIGYSNASRSHCNSCRRLSSFFLCMVSVRRAEGKQKRGCLRHTLFPSSPVTKRKDSVGGTTRFSLSGIG